MTAAISRKVLAIGLPQTGKTTFLAALWDVVCSGEVATSLRLDHLEGEKAHLNEIRNLWADCNEISRTSISGECTVSMTLRDPRSGAVTQIFFPDMDGESFEEQWTERAWTESYATLAAEATGALLFVHPKKVKEAPLIVDAERLAASLLEAKPSAEAPVETAPPPVGTQDETSADTNGDAAPPLAERTLPPEPTYAATQVQLVELVQFVRRIKRGANAFRLCVLVSAWDLLRRQGCQDPSSWLQRRLPLLHQYLVANADTMRFKVFGISAQGGELAEASNLRKALRPSDRIMVVQGRSTTRDITEPLRWLFDLLPETAT